MGFFRGLVVVCAAATMVLTAINDDPPSKLVAILWMVQTILWVGIAGDQP
jgi:hypothetical protein